MTAIHICSLLVVANVSQTSSPRSRRTTARSALAGGRCYSLAAQRAAASLTACHLHCVVTHRKHTRSNSRIMRRRWAQTFFATRVPRRTVDVGQHVPLLAAGPRGGGPRAGCSGFLLMAWDCALHDRLRDGSSVPESIMQRIPCAD